ncbi:TMEM165/GDT1 family protein [Ferrimicrobium sp.]|uniref:TMEM165/GDT1 family protein n=1 Tax=Ferrimicrobium sp. TaxID=2926050 RepID=UPI002628DF37|nr:TMEM165/GDT1 family protein [Ferrimicrobium sp.]
MTIAEFLLILVITLAAELTDKSMVAAVLLSRRNGAATTVSAAITAVGLEAFIVAFIANSIRLILKGSIIHIVTGIVLTGIGLLLLWRALHGEAEESQDDQRTSSWLKIFVIFFLAELGDVTQATTAGFSLATGAPIWVGLAATLGMGISITTAVALTRYTQHLSQRLLYTLAGLIILVLAGLSFAGIGM